MIIGIDIDNTLTEVQEELNKAAYDYAIKLGKNIENSENSLEDIKNNGDLYRKKFQFTYEELKYFLKDIQEEITNNAKPREGAVETIKKLREDGHKIYIVTARDSEFHDDPYNQSKNWLDKNNIEYDKLIVNAREKAPVGLKMLTLTNYFKFSDSYATNYLLIVGLLADGVGIIALKYLTPKNDYLTVTIKFGIRFIGYVIAFISNNIIITLIAITWSILISTAYENICDAVYINRLENKYQLSFSNLCHIIRFLGEAIGVFLCGLMYENGLRYMFGLSALFMIFQIVLAYYMIYLRKNKNE